MRVKCGGSLVEKEDRRPAEEGSGEDDALLLTDRELITTTTHGSVEAVPADG